MSEPKLISPMLDDFTMGDAFSDRHGVRCCPAMPNSSDRRYIVKIISIPASQVQLQALLLTGAFQNETAARDYFLDLAQNTLDEKDVLDKLSKMEGFLPYEDCQIVPMENAVGYDIYLLSPYRRSLAKHLRKGPMTHLAAVNLGLDMCASLAVARQAGYLYIDLKPENVFICNDNEYRIGDLGFLRLNALKFASLPDRYISAYTAPEVLDAYSDVNATLDTYAAGMILYQVYNGGELPFEGRANGEPLPSPAYADYEMAEIIMKACDPDPAKRWEDPIAMGQALVAYMQRNSVNDTPIVTAIEEHTQPEEPAAENAAEEAAEEGMIAEEAISEEAAEEAPEEEPVEQICLDEFYELLGDEEDVPSEEPAPQEPEDLFDDSEDDDEDYDEDEELLNLSFLDEMVSDDTAPSEEMAEEFTYDELSSDASAILAQADDLISHETPEGVVQPEPIDVPIPEPIVPEAEEPEEPETAEAEEAPAEEDAEPEAEEPAEEEESEPELTEEERKELAREADRIQRRKRAARKKVMKRIGVAVLVLLLISALVLGAYLFYNEYYMRSVTSLTLSGSVDKLVVNVVANVDDSELTVHCSDTHGTTQSAAVEDGRATFTGLNPNTLYTIKVEVSGLHKLTGEIEDSYTTPVQTNIVNFTAVTGSDPGSAILTFTVEGMDSDTWSVTYWTEGEEERKQIFSGRVVNIYDLTVGKEYTFKLESGSSLYISGNDTLQHTAVDPVFAQNLAITGCTESTLDVQWNAPEGVVVDSWSVRCYSDTSYDQTVVTSDTAVTFTGLNGNEAHTVEVIANGMSIGSRCYMSANAVTLSNVQATKHEANNLLLTWDYAGNAPTSQWIITYNIDGSSYYEMVRSNTNSAVLSPLVPGAMYKVVILLEDGTTVFAEPFNVFAPEAENFSGYLLTSDNITAQMCNTPAYAGWTHNDIGEYTTSFQAGTKASFVLHTSRNYNTSEDIITSMFVIHDENGVLVSSNTSQERWINMWYKRYCELDIPAMPEAPGNYTVSLYFNGMYVLTQEFTIEAN